MSDDKRFLRYLEDKEAQFVTPTELIAALAKSGKISKREALEGLSKLEAVVSEKALESAKRKLR